MSKPLDPSKVDFSVNINDLSYPSVFRASRLSHKHCYSHGRLMHGQKYQAVDDLLNRAIHEARLVYEAANNCGTYFYRSHVSDRYADGKWMKDAKNRLAFDREFRIKHPKAWEANRRDSAIRREARKAAKSRTDDAYYEDQGLREL